MSKELCSFGGNGGFGSRALTEIEYEQRGRIAELQREIDQFKADEPKKLAELAELRARGRQYAEELQQVAEAVGMPLARGTSVIARVRELVILANAASEQQPGWQRTSHAN